MTRYGLSALPEIDDVVASARRILVAADFDGTLCPIAPSPAEARVTPAMAEVLRRLGGCGRITLALLSGRPLRDLVCRAPSGHVYGGNHGLEIGGRGMAFEHTAAAALRPELNAACEAVSEAVRRWPGAWVENKRLSATLHYRKTDPREQRALRFAARRAAAPFGAALRMRSGKKALELCPRVDWDKGRALEFIRQRIGPFDACIAIGDDLTDEAMFRANAGGVNIKVGSAREPTLAGFHLCNCTETALLLEHVVDVCESRGAPVDAAASPGRGSFQISPPLVARP